MKGRKHTIRTHPQVAEIDEQILSGGVSYREIAARYGVSISAVKRYAVELKNEPSNNEPSRRDIPRQSENVDQTEIERQVRELEDKLKSKFAIFGQHASDEEILELQALKKKLRVHEQSANPKPRRRVKVFMSGVCEYEDRVFAQRLLVREKEAYRNPPRSGPRGW